METSRKGLNSKESSLELGNLSDSIPTWVVVGYMERAKFDFKIHDNPIFDLLTINPISL